MSRLRQICKKYNVKSPARIIGPPREGVLGDIEILLENNRHLEQTKPADVDDKSTSHIIIHSVDKIKDIPDRIYWLEEAKRYCDQIKKQLKPDLELSRKNAKKFGPFKPPSHAPLGFSEAVQSIYEQLQLCRTKALEAQNYTLDESAQALGIDKRALSNKMKYFDYAYEIYHLGHKWEEVYEIIENERSAVTKRRYNNFNSFKRGKARYNQKKKKNRK